MNEVQKALMDGDVDGALKLASTEYQRTRAILARGEAAQVADPVESGLWYVDYPGNLLQEFEANKERWLERAADVIRWSNELAA